MRALNRLRLYGGASHLSARQFLVALFVYVAAVFLIKAFLYQGAMGHDADQIVKAQFLQWGYDSRNPPLYTWLVIASEQVFGVGIIAVAAVKSLLIFLTYYFLYQSARIVLADERLALLAAIAPVAMYHFGWWLPVKYSNTAALVTLCAAMFYMVLRLEQSGATKWYVLLGATIGLGLLSKYNFALFAGSLILALMFEKSFRRSILDRRMIVALLIATAMVAPHGWWMVDNAAELDAVTQLRFGVGTDRDLLAILGRGFYGFAKAAITMALPLGLIVPVLAWWSWHTGPATSEDNPAPQPSRRYFRLIGLFLVLLTVASLILIFVSGATRVRAHYLFIFIVFPMWLVTWMQAINLPRRTLDKIWMAFVAIAVIVPVLMAGRFYLEARYKPYPIYNIPFAEIADDIRQAGFRNGTILAHDYPYSISGNIRPYFPASRIGTPPPGTVRRSENRAGQCLLVWVVDKKSSNARNMIARAEKQFGFDSAAFEPLRLAVDYDITHGGERRVRFEYMIFPNGAGRCR